MISSVTTTRYDDLRRIEAEVGTLIRRVKRVMGSGPARSTPTCTR